MKRRGYQYIFLLLGLLALGLTTACRSVQPIAAYSDEEKAARLERAQAFGEYYVNRMKLFLDDNPHRETGGTIFLGDSITERFPCEEAFPDRNVVNRGIGGDSIPGVKSRLDTSVADLQPRKIYLTIGVNDLMWSKLTMDEHEANYDALLAALRETAPDASLTIFSILPVRGKWADRQNKIIEMNKKLPPLAEKYGAEYVDLWPQMAERGQLREEYSLDGIHLTLPGYLAWLAVILPDDEEYQQAVVSLAPKWSVAYPDEWPVAAINPTPGEQKAEGGRGKDMMVIFTPEYHQSTTGTNDWGVETVVADGKVLRDPAGNNTVIEPGTMVVSGHGSAASWINANLRAGQEVELVDMRLVLRNPKVTSAWIEYWHAVASLNRRGASEKEWKQARALLGLIRRDPAKFKDEIVEALRMLNPERYR